MIGSNSLARRLRWQAFSLLFFVLYPARNGAQTGVPIPDQTRTVPKLRFEVVSIRPSPPGTAQSFTQDIQPDGYRARGQSIHNTILVAYLPLRWMFWPRGPLKGEPSWVGNDLYDIDAKVAPEDIPAWQKQGNSPEQRTMLQAMLQAALEDRCKLLVHTVPGQTSGYGLIVGKGGPKFRESVAGAAVPAGGMAFPDGGKMIPDRSGHTSFFGVSMSWFAASLSMLSGGPSGMPLIQDRTGLTGRYDLVIERRDTGQGTESESESRPCDTLGHPTDWS